MDCSENGARVSRGNGSSLEALLSWGVEVRAAIAPVGACPPVQATAIPGTVAVLHLALLAVAVEAST